MTLRNFILLAGLSAFLFGCVIVPRHPHPRGYDDDYYDYSDSPSYQGYFYARIIFIGAIPYYVGDDRVVRPIPHRYREHFRRYNYGTLRRPPVFSRDTEVRDGYPVSRIVYLNGVPYHVGDNRRAQALPHNLRDRFRYTPSREGISPRNDNRIERFDRGRDNRRIEPSGNTRERSRKDRMIFESGRQTSQQPRTNSRSANGRERKEENNRLKFDRRNSRENRDEGRD